MGRALVLALLAFCLVGCASARYGSPANDEKEFVPGQPQETFKSSGGRVEVWSPDFKQLQDADIGAGIVTIESQSLALPHYADSAMINYVIEGEACVGLITPLGMPTNMRRLRKGDAYIHPRGWAHWAWNNGNQPFRAVSMADTSKGPQRGQYTSFHLIGAQKEQSGGILHGFSSDLLARAWNVEENDVKQLLQGQKETAFVKVQQRSQVDALNAAIDALNARSGENIFGDFSYNLIENEADIQREGAGRVTWASGWKLPMFRKVGFSAARFELEQNALTAPHWLANSAALIYVLNGQGRFEMTHSDGRTAVRRDMKQGELIVIPPGLPHATLASGNGIEYIALITKSRPQVGFLAGANSVYRFLPRAIQQAAFNADDQLIEKLRSTRQHEYVILPPKGQKPKPRAFSEEDEDVDVDFSIIDTPYGF
ncbi:unnamed protein product [Closterium sp. NIES-54]